MADLSPTGRKYAIGIATLFLLAALGLGVTSMFYVGWIKYTVTTPAVPSQDFRDGENSSFVYHSRQRGLFYYMVDNADASIVKDRNGNQYFPVRYNYNAPDGVPQDVGFWSITAIMKASVGLHVAYLVAVALACWMVVFSNFLGKRLVHLALATLVLGLLSGGFGLGLFHIYIEMEKSSDVPSLPDIYYHWSEELKVATSETLYLSFGIHIGSFGATILSMLLTILLASSWAQSGPVVDEGAPSDKVNIYTRDNLAYDDNMADKPARAELWNGFDRLSEKRAPSVGKLRANYPREHEPDYPHHHHHHNHHHHSTADRGEDRFERVATPTRQHYHTDPANFSMRY